MLKWMTIGMWLWLILTTVSVFLWSPQMTMRLGTVGIFMAIMSAMSHLAQIDRMVSQHGNSETDVTRKAKRENLWLEAIVVGVATLQTGFGDIIHECLHSAFA